MSTLIRDLSCVVLGLAGMGTLAVFSLLFLFGLAVDLTRWAVRGR